MIYLSCPLDLLIPISPAPRPAPSEAGTPQILGGWMEVTLPSLPKCTVWSGGGRGPQDELSRQTHRHRGEAAIWRSSPWLTTVKHYPRNRENWPGGPVCVFRPIPHMSRWPGQHSLLGASRETALQLLCSYSSRCPTVQWLQLCFQRIWNYGVVKVKSPSQKTLKFVPIY